MKKKVVIISTGGTIASSPGSQGRNVSGALAGEELVNKIELKSDIDIEVKSVFQKPSNAISLHDLCTLRQECQQLINQGDVSGIVITHGTDTLEDTAYFLESTLNTLNTVVVVTGSQRVPHAMGTDAYLNLKNAILTAGDDKTKGMGVLVVFNEAIYSANFVRKTSSFQVNGFDAPGTGWLGLIDNESISVFQKPLRQIQLDAADPLPAVDILTTYLGARSFLLDAAVDAGAQGIVLEALGRGHTPPDWVPAVKRAVAAGVVVAVCTSSLHGPVHQSYEFPGSLFDLEAAGAIGVSGLSARKTRMRLSLLLGQKTTDRKSIIQAFDWTAARQK
ncbi:MAG TPA: asparaginase [Candidimonas sp.]|nr:asparaginase [Candidimonas sp.]